jgi:cholesterol transport system auxiliary component
MTMNSLRTLIVLAATLFLAACAGNGRQDEAGRYDFGGLAGPWEPPGISIGAVEVQASSWLAGSAMEYRLGYADATRRYSYADSRWAAPPAELLERFLTRRIVFRQPDFTGAGCRLRFELDDLTQDFEDARSSRINLEVSAVLTPAHGDGLLSKRAFQIRTAAPTPDARGGVQATRDAVQALAGEINAWLAEVARSRSQDLNRCL